nr:unnamed protein product [Leishmania braziliensis]
MSTLASSVLQGQREKSAWLEEALDTCIVAYESHRNALENVYSQLTTWQQSSDQGCIHISPVAMSELLKDINDVLQQCALQLQPMDGATSSAESPVEQAQPEHRFWGAHLQSDNASSVSTYSTRRNKPLPAPPQQEQHLLPRSASELSSASQSRGTENDLQASSAMTESQRRLQPSPMLQYHPFSTSRSSMSSVLPAVNESAATDPSKSPAQLDNTAQKPMRPPEQRQQRQQRQQAAAAVQSTRPRTPPRNWHSAAPTPRPTIDDGHQTGSAATGPTVRSSGGSTPLSASQRAEAEHVKLSSQEQRTATREDAKTNGTYQHLFGTRSCNSDSTGRHGPPSTPSVTSASPADAGSAASQHPPPHREVQRSQGYVSEEVGTPHHQSFSSAAERRSSNMASCSHFDSCRFEFFGTDQGAGSALAAASGHQTAAVAFHYSHQTPSHQQSNDGCGSLSQTSIALRDGVPGATVAAAASLSYPSSSTPRRPHQMLSGDEKKSEVDKQRSSSAAEAQRGEASQAGSVGLVHTPSATPQRDSSSRTTVAAPPPPPPQQQQQVSIERESLNLPLPPQQPGKRRPLRTSSQRITPRKMNDSSQVESTVYHRSASPSTGRQPLRADAPEALCFMEREDNFLVKRRLAERKAMHGDIHQVQGNAERDANPLITAGPGRQLVANGGMTGKVEAAPALTAVEEQLISEHTVLRTQLERMQMELYIAVMRHRERGNEPRYTQLNTRMKRVMKDLSRVEWELRVVRNIDCESHSKSPAKGA